MGHRGGGKGGRKGAGLTFSPSIDLELSVLEDRG